MEPEAALLLESVSRLTVFGVLAGAGLQHLGHISSLVAALQQQKTVPPRIAFPVAVMVATIESTVGLGGIILSIGILGSPELLQLLQGGAMLICVAYLVYSTFLVTRRRGVTCGCDDSGLPADWWTVSRAGLLAMVAAIGISTPQQPLLAADPFVVVLAFPIAGAFVCLAVLLPSSMSAQRISR